MKIFSFSFAMLTIALLGLSSQAAMAVLSGNYLKNYPGLSQLTPALADVLLKGLPAILAAYHFAPSSLNQEEPQSIPSMPLIDNEQELVPRVVQGQAPTQEENNDEAAYAALLAEMEEEEEREEREEQEREEREERRYLMFHSGND